MSYWTDVSIQSFLASRARFACYYPSKYKMTVAYFVSYEDKGIKEMIVFNLMCFHIYSDIDNVFIKLDNLQFYPSPLSANNVLFLTLCLAIPKKFEKNFAFLITLQII